MEGSWHCHDRDCGEHTSFAAWLATNINVRCVGIGSKVDTYPKRVFCCLYVFHRNEHRMIMHELQQVFFPRVPGNMHALMSYSAHWHV